MMTQEKFDEFIKTPRKITEDIYKENKELFDQAEKQKKICIKKEFTQITDGNIQHPQSTTYRIEPLVL